MKKLRCISSNYILIAIIASVLILSKASIAIGQSEEAKIKSSLTANDYTIFEVIYINLQEKCSYTRYIKFTNSMSYKIVAFSENKDVKDIDLLLSDNLGNLISRDIHYHNHGILFFNPHSTSDYILEIRNHDSLSDAELYLCGVIIACKSDIEGKQN